MMDGVLLTYVDHRPAGSFLPREVHELVVRSLEQADRPLAEVCREVELFATLGLHLHLSRFETQQGLRILS